MLFLVSFYREYSSEYNVSFYCAFVFVLYLNVRVFYVLPFGVISDDDDDKPCICRVASGTRGLRRLIRNENDLAGVR